MPDFDIDFCQDGRDRVIDYVRDKYGRDAVAARSSPSARCRRARCCATSAACSACRYGQVDRICKLIPFNPAKPVTLAKALETEPLPEGAVRRATRRSSG